MNYYLDTEFFEDGKTIDLISLALVSEDGRELYLINKDFDFLRARNLMDYNGDHWVMDNVLKPMSEQEGFGDDPWGMTLDSNKSVFYREFADKILEFIGEDKNPEFYAYYADYDWVVFCQLFGRMIDLPGHFPQFCMDLKQMMIERSLGKEWKDDMCPDPDGEHNALVDANWNKRLYQCIFDHDYAMFRIPKTISNKKLDICFKALNDIVNPIPAMEQDMREYRINGSVAVELSNDPAYLKEIAKDAINEILKIEKR